LEVKEERGRTAWRSEVARDVILNALLARTFYACIRGRSWRCGMAFVDVTGQQITMWRGKEANNATIPSDSDFDIKI
jgi:hypothetical protein